MAEVVTRELGRTTRPASGGASGDWLHVASAGTSPWHEGGPMDRRAADALHRAGYPDHRHVAHHVATAGLLRYDLIVALDRSHQQTLRSLGAVRERLVLLRAFDPAAGANADVPDPYYGDEYEFDACLAMIVSGSRGLVSALASLEESADSP
jgi:protein-tyrosine phosphatase